MAQRYALCLLTNSDTSQSTAPLAAADAADDFNPLDAFLADLGPEPPKTSANQSDDADTVSQNETQHAAVKPAAATTSCSRLSAHADRGVDVESRTTSTHVLASLLVNNSIDID
jgi:hypothetical protein